MAFNNLPVELNQHIATYLTNDSDLCSFTLVCYQTHAAVHTPRSSVWRQRFNEIFDIIPGRQSHELKMQYQHRRRVLRKGAHFVLGRGSEERSCLEVIRDLIIESFANTASSSPTSSHSNNLHQLYEFIRNTDLLERLCPAQVRKYGVCQGTAEPLLQVIQLMCTHWSLDLSLGYETYNFDISQQMVYQHPDQCPLFLDQHMCSININFLLHIMNFFKYHCTRSDEWTLRGLFEALEPYQRPQAWDTQLSQGPSPLGSNWLGSYAFLPSSKEIVAIRNNPGDRLFMDSIDTRDGFQTLTLDFSPPPSTAMPDVFERHLQSLPSPTLVHALQTHLPTQKVTRSGVRRVQGPGGITKSSRKTSPKHKKNFTPSPASTPSRKTNLPTPKRGRDYLMFTGSGTDAEPFHCTGNIHALPLQFGIPGWQRITLMKYFDPPAASPSSSAPSSPNPFAGASADDLGAGVGWHGAEVDDGCWAYEGVVLPGGKVVLGRWWSPLDPTGEREWAGPFIFWNVPVEGEEG
ncbi:MAG: hypothetical protein FRX48_05186 [Lasallia pustulata]|uniref:F-box domain-containing protein n=1 Tax=Lasallia pustulata TaxID=136370 RepID=A0A5M8PQN2_9LECA|nr:MAG: hypothetical protein FRX48_05186 [Lasallia pustulata]